MTSVLALISFSFFIHQAFAVDCLREFQKNLKFFQGEVTPNSLLDYQQNRFEWIYPQLFSLEVDAMEKLELVRTLEQLELLNNKKVLFSEYENQFSGIYQIFVKKGLDTSNLHDYFRALVRGDPEAAKQIGDLILSGIQEGNREKFSKLSGIHSSKSDFWKTYRKPPEINTKLIQYSDDRNFDASGFRVEVEKNSQNEKYRIVELTKSMEDIHGVQVISVPQAIERLSSNGFSIRNAQFKPFQAGDEKLVAAPMIVIPEKDLLYDRISNTATHEARHAYYATLREQFSTSPFDVSVFALNKKPLGEANGYQHFQTYEEVSTHSKDLMAGTRTGNREILKLYQTK